MPSAATAPKNFRGIHLVLSRDGLLTTEEMAYFEVLARRSEERGTVPANTGRAAAFGNPWFAATRGKSTMTAKLSTQPLPTLAYGGVVNAGSFRASDLGPGAVATIFGSDLAATTASASSVPLPLTLGGLRVMVNGRPAPLFYVSPTQINFQLPADVSVTPYQANDPSALAAVHVERDGVGSNLAFIEIRAGAPGIITYGEGVAVATLPDGSVMGPSNPAAPGQTITVYWVGSAPLSEAIPAGTPAPGDRLVRVTGPASVTVNGGSQTVAFLGATPGGVGLFQANVQLGATLASGDYSLALTVGGRVSNGARLFVRRP